MGSKTYYAHLIDFVGRGTFSDKYAVNFEAVPMKPVEMFVTGELPDQMSGEGSEFIAESQFFKSTWNQYVTYGPESEEFLEMKPRYLSELPAVQIMLLFEDLGSAYQVWEEENDWWEIEIDYDSSNPGDPVSAFSSEMPEMDTEFRVGHYWSLPGEVNETLYDLYVESGESFQDISNSDKRESDRISFGAITPNTVFSKVQVLYVGAGLCCRLVDWVGHVVGYFDMGEELPLSAGRLTRLSPATAPVLHQKKQQSINIMVQDAAARTPLTVIISHWHYDHVRVLSWLAREYLQYGTYAEFWTNLTLICPAMVRWRGWSVTDYNSIRAVMNQVNPNGMQFVQHVPGFQTQTRNLGNNITLYKGDAGGARTVLQDPHNHGLAAEIRLGGMGGNVAFLPGDCSYDTLNGLGDLNRGGLGYEYLVATHHGGTYTYDKQSRPAVIPDPDIQGHNLIYSANGVAYGHPDPTVVGEYANQNWNPFVALHQFCQTGQFIGFELL